jgi:predicted Zn-dependent peptidase
MLFNGTTSRTQRELYDEVDRYGAYNNATTREDHTLFTLLIQKEFAEQGLDIQADMLFRSVLPEENFEKEKGIVLEEMARDASDPGYVAARRFRAVAFAGTPLASPVLGTVESIEAISRDQLVSYYRSRYVPSNMILVVMGDFEAEGMLAAVGRTFGASGRGKSPDATGAKSWPGVADKNLVVYALEAPRRYLHAAFPLGLEPHDPLVPAVELLLDALADGKDAPLQRVLTSGDEPAVMGAALGTRLRAGRWSTVEFEATLPPEKPFEPVMERLAEGLFHLGPGSPARSRLDLVRAAIRSREILTADQIHYFAMMNSDALLGSPEGWLGGAARRFDGVTPEQLELAAEHLARQFAAVRIAVSGPGMEPGQFHWKPERNVEQVVADRQSRLVRTLSNGVRVVVERNDDSQVFATHVLLRPRSASEPVDKLGIVSFLHRSLPRGTSTMDEAALSARLARLGATLKTDDDGRVPYDDYYTTQEFSFLRAEAPADGWRETIALLAELLIRPRLDEVDVEKVRREMLDLQTRRRDSSRNRAVETLEAALAPAHPITRPVLGTAETVASITPNQLRHFHKVFLTGPRLIVTVVAPLDPGEVAEALESAFGQLPAEPPIPEVPAVPVTVSGKDLPISSALPEQVTIAMSYVFDAPSEEWAALTLLGAMLSDDLAFELRERKGLAYAVGASVTPWGGRMRLQVQMGTRRENLDEALSALREGVAGFRPKDDDSVRRAAASVRGRMLMRRLTRVNQAYYLGLEAMEGRSPGDSLARLDALLRQDRKSIEQAASRYLNSTRLVVAVQ